MGVPPLPYRARPPQVLLGVGAVLVISAAAAVVGAYGGIAARFPLLLLAVAAAGCSLLASLQALRSTEETLAACAAGLALSAGALGGGSPLPLALIAAACLVLHGVAPSTAVWPLASWTALQWAVLRTVHAVPGSMHPTLFLGVSLVGLAIALWGRRLVARLALVTTAPWWIAGVLGGTAAAWTGPGPARHLAALLVVVAAAGLLPARLRADLDRLVGPAGAAACRPGPAAGPAGRRPAAGRGRGRHRDLGLTGRVGGSGDHRGRLRRRAGRDDVAPATERLAARAVRADRRGRGVDDGAGRACRVVGAEGLGGAVVAVPPHRRARGADRVAAAGRAADGRSLVRGLPGRGRRLHGAARLAG